MPKMKMTELAIRNLKSTDRQVEYFDQNFSPGVSGSLGLRVSRGGRKSWFIAYRLRDDARQVKQKYTFDGYPDVSLKGARKQAGVLLAQIHSGANPKAEQQARRQALTFRELCDLYLEKHAYKKKAASSAKGDRQAIDRDLVPVWGKMKAGDIKKRDVISLIDDIGNRAPVMANRTLALVSKIFNFAIDRDILDRNPAVRVKRVVVERPRERVLTEDEIRILWEIFDGLGTNGRRVLSPLMSAMMKVRLFTAQRHAEVSRMRWQDIHDDMWEIPAEFTKNNNSHRVPLTKPVLDILSSLPQASEWVFPSPRNSATYISNVHKALNRLRKESGIDDFTLHDFRRTAASFMARSSVPRFEIARVLNHADSSVTGIYDRYGYDREKRRALEKWADRLQRITADEKAKIVNLR